MNDSNQQGFAIEITKINNDNTSTNLYLKGVRLIEEQSSRGTYSAITENNKLQWKTRDIPDLCQVIHPILKHKAYSPKGCKIVANAKEEPVHVWDLQCRRCNRLIRVYKLKEYFGYYSTNETCNHQEPTGSLPTPIVKLCMNRADEKNAATKIISFLQLQKDDIQQTRMFFEDPNLQKHPMLNNTEYWNKIMSQIKSKCTELRRKKRKGNNSQVKSTYSKKMTRPISSVKQSLENNFAHLEKIMNSNQLSLTPIELINLLPKNDEALWYTYHDMDENGDYNSIQWLLKDSIPKVKDALDASADTGLPVMLQCDYTHSKIPNHQGMIGTVGIADPGFHFHTISHDLNKSENTNDSDNLIKTAALLLTILGYKVEIHGKRFAMMDGSTQLKKASERNGFIPKRCGVHIF